MRILVATVFGAALLGGVAHAQSAPSEPGSWYLEGIAQSAFGNVTSQSFGAEAGITVLPAVQVFVDAGKVRDAATTDIGANAQTIADFLTQTQTGVAFKVREPVTFGLAGVRYALPVTSPVEPYVLGGFGVASVTKDVTFTVGGTDVTGNIGQYGVVLGSDLAGSVRKPMMSLGGGVVWPAWERLVVDFQYRYGRIFTPNQGLNVNRLGAGIGVRF
jgi:opacity protein-like surface antigen